MGTRDIVLTGGGPWGFTLSGGKDFGAPLKVSKVSVINSILKMKASVIGIILLFKHPVLVVARLMCKIEGQHYRFTPDLRLTSAGVRSCVYGCSGCSFNETLLHTGCIQVVPMDT